MIPKSVCQPARPDPNLILAWIYGSSATPWVMTLMRGADTLPRRFFGTVSKVVWHGHDNLS